jgi:hypothetical protein
MVEAYLMGRRPDVVLAGVPKSGTSMLCNAMTVAGQTVVLYEPTRGGFRADRVRIQAGSLGYHGHNILGWARKHSKWGVKEVLADSIRQAVRWRPEHVVLLIRDLRHVALSTYETNQRIPWDLDYRRQRLLATAEALLELTQTLPTDQLTICRYEAFVASDQYREAFRRSLNWPSIDGDVARGLATWLERPHEADRHGGRITANSVDYRQSSREPEPERFAREILAACPSFNEKFGYEN